MALSVCSTKTDTQGRELIEHGSPLFPIACYHDNLAGEEVPWHWHEDLEAAVVSEGRTIIAAGTENYTLSKWDAFFINGGVLHAMWDADHSGSRYHSIVFHPRLVGGSVDSIFWQNYIQPLLGSDRRYRCPMRIFRHQLFYKNLPGAEGMYSGRIPQTKTHFPIAKQYCRIQDTLNIS